MQVHGQRTQGDPPALPAGDTGQQRGGPVKDDPRVQQRQDDVRDDEQRPGDGGRPVHADARQPRSGAQSRPDQPEHDRHRQQAHGHQPAGAHDEPRPRHLVHAASSISGHWPTVWAVARPDPDHRVNSPCSPRSANQAGASPSRSIPAVAATFAAVALAASAETAHQPVSALRPVRGSMRWWAGPGRRQPPAPALAAGRQPSVGDPDRALGQPRDLVVRADDPARGRGDDPQVATHVGDHVESELVGDPLGDLVGQPGLGRRPEVEGDPRGDAHPPGGHLDLAPRTRGRGEPGPPHPGPRRHRRPRSGTRRHPPAGPGTGRPGRRSTRRRPGPPRPARRAARWPGPTVPAARLTPEISESARNLLATCSRRVDLVGEDLPSPPDAGRVAEPGRVTASVVRHRCSTISMMLMRSSTWPSGRSPRASGAAGAGATTVREGRGLGADRTALLLGGRLGPGRLDAGRALPGGDPDVDLAVDDDGLGRDMALLDPRDHHGPGDRHVADRIRDHLGRRLQRGLLRTTAPTCPRPGPRPPLPHRPRAHHC